jgi:hypothetical protein
LFTKLVTRPYFSRRGQFWGRAALAPVAVRPRRFWLFAWYAPFTSFPHPFLSAEVLRGCYAQQGSEGGTWQDQGFLK